MTQAEFPAGVLKRAVWAHLSGIAWAMLSVAWQMVSIPLSLVSSSLEPLGDLALYPFLGLMIVATLLSFPFLSGFVTALVFWKMNREKHPFIDECGKAATNFQATMGLYSFCTFLVFAFLVLVTCGPALAGLSNGGNGGNGSEGIFMVLGILTLVLGGLIAFAVWLFQVIVMSVAAAKAGKGQVYVYPLSRQFFS